MVENVEELRQFEKVVVNNVNTYVPLVHASSFFAHFTVTN